MSGNVATFDVAVVGAGPAGTATARRLARRGCRVALIERTRFRDPRIGESLAPAVQPLLAELGVWQDFLSLEPQPSYGTRSVWGGPTAEVHSHLASPWGCGWHVDRLAFDRMLAEAARAAGAAFSCGTTVVGCEPTEGGWTLELQDRGDDASTVRSTRLQAKVTIDATGRAARLAPYLDARRQPFDHLVAVATQFEGIDTGNEGYVMVETTPDGWWYTAPIPHGRMMAMLMTDGDLCGRAGLATAPAWHGRLQEAGDTSARVARGRISWGPRVFSAVSYRLRRRERSARWLAVGDAALAVDPISGSGVVRALRTARAAEATVLALLEREHPDPIEAYEAERDAECTAYLNDRALYYGVERRWRDASFWRRRAAACALAATTATR